MSKSRMTLKSEDHRHQSADRVMGLFLTTMSIHTHTTNNKHKHRGTKIKCFLKAQWTRQGFLKNPFKWGIWQENFQALTQALRTLPPLWRQTNGDGGPQRHSCVLPYWAAGCQQKWHSFATAAAVCHPILSTDITRLPQPTMTQQITPNLPHDIQLPVPFSHIHFPRSQTIKTKMAVQKKNKKTWGLA